MLFVLPLCSCESGDALARRNLETLILSIENYNSEKASSLFSTNIVKTIPDFNDDVIELLEFYTGLFEK